MLKRHFQDAKACLREIENFKEICKKRSYPDNVVLYFGTEEKVCSFVYMRYCIETSHNKESWATAHSNQFVLVTLTKSRLIYEFDS